MMAPLFSRNYVVFDDKIVNILRKYAVPGAVGGAATAGSGSTDAFAADIDRQLKAALAE